MRSIISLTLITAIAVASCDDKSNRKASSDIVSNPVSADDTAAIPAKLPEMVFDQNIFDFGTIKEGDEVKHTYTFKNSGNAELLISNASASCGCTVPNWPRQPIRPGESAGIDVTFNSAGKGGKVEKTIHITANTRPTETILVIKGEVIRK